MSLLCLEKSDGTDPRLGIAVSWPLPAAVNPVPSPFPAAPTGAEPRRFVKIYFIGRKKKYIFIYIYTFGFIFFNKNLYGILIGNS